MNKQELKTDLLSAADTLETIAEIAKQGGDPKALLEQIAEISSLCADDIRTLINEGVLS